MVKIGQILGTVYDFLNRSDMTALRSKQRQLVNGDVI
jgi:hypothetical protein